MHRFKWLFDDPVDTVMFVVGVVVILLAFHHG